MASRSVGTRRWPLEGLRHLAVVGTIISCSGSLGPDPVSMDKCPSAQGEFGPTDCAIVKGVAKDGRGLTLPNAPVRVDSAIAQVAYVYASSTVTTGADGTFTLVVLRISRVKAPTVPDTATVEIKTYSVPNPTAGAVPAGRAKIRMRFAEMGQPVVLTQGEFVFDVP